MGNASRPYVCQIGEFVCRGGILYLLVSDLVWLEMSTFVPRTLTGRQVFGAGGCDGCNGADHDDDARAGPIQGHSGRGGRQAQATACGGTTGIDDAAGSPAGRPAA